MQCNARAQADRHQSIARGGSRGEAARKGVVQLGGHHSDRNTGAAHGSRSRAPLVRLDRRVDLQLPPIVMVVLWSQRQKVGGLRDRGAISVAAGQCSGSKGPWGVLEAGRSARGGSGSPGRASRGARWKGGAREAPWALRAQVPSCRFCPGL
jgi:hypothetical protein